MSTKRDWLHFITGFMTAVIITSAFHSVCEGASPRDIVATALNEDVTVKNNVNGTQEK